MFARNKTTRRIFLSHTLKALLLGVFSATVLMVATGAKASLPDKNFGVLQRDLLRFLSNRRSARVIGALYLKAAPEEADGETLMSRILEATPGLDIALRGSRIRAAKRLLLSRHRQDFDEGRVVNLNGWVLSQSEARIYALSAARTR